jgi:hypothetical protein
VSACRLGCTRHTVSVTGHAGSQSLSLHTPHGSAPNDAKMWCGNTGEETTYKSGRVTLFHAIHLLKCWPVGYSLWDCAGAASLRQTLLAVRCV